MRNARQLAIDGLRKGDRFTVTRAFTMEDIQRFAEISRDYNPVHVDLPYAQLRNFRAPISHGLLTASLLTEVGGQIGWLATGMNFRFKRPVYSGELITCVWEITDIDERGRAQASIQITNPDGEVVLEAETSGVLPGEKERARLREMVAEGDPTNGAKV
ncbi:MULTISPECIES: MaoC family dehydratase [Pseudomonas aeruginosa group]|uniref:MaoC family dehydratase n=1 Tax=Pseudomonas nitroreducens TaxID=46680 RepID=A0A6G6J7Q2_PSENT|nr:MULTISPECIES: MaoC family dehydratase [Pseudomonas]MCE4071447.1 MaoC family dehydratase [Pseudomonas nitritireducens]MCE4081223.1 MaoC family dehydratase [Pseudomonas nitroreducens]QIE91233.1 MaoC family dehydratase [Pseudomonas nitroreducens]